jgi:hypothetical protein
MATAESITEKINENFTKLPTINDQKRCLQNLTILMTDRIESENKTLQETIEANNKLKQ